MAAGCAAAAAFVTPTYGELTPYQQHHLRRKMQDWLAPCLLALPRGATGTKVLAGAYDDEFIRAGAAFLVSRLRDNELYDSYTDDELKARQSPEALSEAANNLAYLTSVALDEALTTPTDKPIGWTRSEPLEALADRLPAWDADEELKRLLGER